MVTSFQNAAIYFHSVNFIANPIYITNMSFVVFNDTDGASRLNLTLLLTIDIPKVISYFTLSVKYDPNDQDYKRVVLKTSANHCKVGEGVLGNFLIKIVVKALENHSNFTYACPQRKGFYHLTNFKAPNINVPHYLIGFNGNFELIITLKGKLASSKPLFQAVTMKLYGGLYDEL